MAGSREDKRDTERIQILGELHGEVMVFQPMAIKEISRGGAQVETGVSAAPRFPARIPADARRALGRRQGTRRPLQHHRRRAGAACSTAPASSSSSRRSASRVIADFIDAVKTGRALA